MRIKGQGDQNLRQLKVEWIKDTSSSYQERPMDMSYFQDTGLIKLNNNIVFYYILFHPNGFILENYSVLKTI